MSASSSPIDLPEFNGDWLSSPPAPEAAHYDEASGALVLSRHADVLATLREPALYQVGREGRIEPALEREGRRLRLRAELTAVLTWSMLAEQRTRAAALARTLLDRLPAKKPVDLLTAFVQPWALAIALDVAGIASGPAARLTGLQGRLFGSASDRQSAQEELKSFFRESGTPVAESLFTGTADTLPRFLANAVLALVRHPAELRRLHTRAELTSAALEELLRYGGLVHTLYRRAISDVTCNGISIASGGCAALRPALGNRDPQAFPDPNRLDLGRRFAGHLSLGSGPHSCVGAALVRMAAGVMVESLAERGLAFQLAGPIAWRSGSMLFSPMALPVSVT